MAAWSTSDSDGAQQTVASPVAWLVEPTVTPSEPSNLLDLDISQVKKEDDVMLEKESRLRHASRPHSTPHTMYWLQQTFEASHGACVPRQTLYMRYLDYCDQNSCQPVNQASFGKILRKQFPQITTRRLGTRGQSRYHYYGIRMREMTSSLRHNDVTTSHRSTNCYTAAAVVTPQTEPFATVRASKSSSTDLKGRSDVQLLLTNFPQTPELPLTVNVEPEKVATFLTMYRAHCSRLLDACARRHFAEVKRLVCHFWRNIPAHVTSLLNAHAVIDVIATCDNILYSAVTSALIPSACAQLSEEHLQELETFCYQFTGWLRSAVQNINSSTFIAMKMNLCSRFTWSLREKCKLVRVCDVTARSLADASSRELVRDWRLVDVDGCCQQSLFAIDTHAQRNARVTIMKLCGEFEDLLASGASVKHYTDWAESIVDRFITKSSSHQAQRTCYRTFLLMWAIFSTRAIRDLTLANAQHFDCFHWLSLLLGGCLMHSAESQLNPSVARRSVQPSGYSSCEGSHEVQRTDRFFYGRVTSNELRSNSCCHRIDVPYAPTPAGDVTGAAVNNTCHYEPSTCNHQAQPVFTGYNTLSQALKTSMTSQPPVTNSCCFHDNGQYMRFQPGHTQQTIYTDKPPLFAYCYNT